MTYLVLLAAIASFAMANTRPQDPPVTIRAIGLPEDDGGNALEERDDPPGWLECKQGGFKEPCTRTATGGNGSLDCHKLMYGHRMSNPGMSFKPDKGVTCRFYDTNDCGVLARPLNVEHPGGDLLLLGRAVNTWGPDDVEGFWSFRCRSWQQKDDDQRQSKVGSAERSIRSIWGGPQTTIQTLSVPLLLRCVLTVCIVYQAPQETLILLNERPGRPLKLMFSGLVDAGREHGRSRFGHG